MKSKKGFTLIELIVVLAILAIVAAIAVPTAFSSIENAKVAADNIELGDGGAVTLEIEITYDDGSVESKEYDLY